MSKPENPSKLLVLSCDDAEVVIVAIESAKMSAVTTSQQERIPGLLRCISRYIVADQDEIVEELTQLRKEHKSESKVSQQKRPVGRPPKAATK